MREILYRVFLTGFMLFAMLSASGILRATHNQISNSVAVAGAEVSVIPSSEIDSFFIATIEPRPCQTESACTSPTCTSLFLPTEMSLERYRSSVTKYLSEDLPMAGLKVSPGHGPPRQYS